MLKCGCTETVDCAQHSPSNPERQSAIREASRKDVLLRLSGAIERDVMHVLTLACCSCHISAPCSWCEQNLSEE
jgi:hypothetical protein